MDKILEDRRLECEVKKVAAFAEEHADDMGRFGEWGIVNI